MGKKVLIVLVLIGLLAISSVVFNFDITFLTGRATIEVPRASWCQSSCGGDYPSYGGQIWIQQGSRQAPKVLARGPGCSGGVGWRNDNWFILCGKENNVRLCSKSCGGSYPFEDGRIKLEDMGKFGAPKNSIYGEGCSGSADWRSSGWIYFCSKERNIRTCTNCGGNYYSNGGAIWLPKGKADTFGGSCSSNKPNKNNDAYWIELCSQPLSIYKEEAKKEVVQEVVVEKPKGAMAINPNLANQQLLKEAVIRIGEIKDLENSIPHPDIPITSTAISTEIPVVEPEVVVVETGIKISNCEELQAMENDLTEDYILSNNIDCSGVNFKPIGPDEVGKNYDFFSGSFDGKGYTITGLYINKPSTYNIGLFGKFMRGGEIKNVGMINCNIIGFSHVGCLIGNSQGKITNSYSTGIVNGMTGVGGLVGILETKNGLITNSYSTASVIARSTSNLEGGGLVGKNNIYPTIINSYWNIESSENLNTKYPGGEGKTTAEMKQQSTFTGWDFAGTWAISSNCNNGYPYLRNVGGQC